MLARLLPYVCVMVVQFLLLYPLHNTMDLPIWDEAIYVGQGARFLHGDTLGAIFISPIYSLLYSSLIRIFGSIHSVFYMQYLVKITVSTLLLLTLVEHLRSRSLALLLTLIWVASGVNIFERVLVYHVALGLFLLALFFLNKHRGIALLLLCLSSLTRLEYVFPTLAFAAFLTYMAVSNRKNNRFEFVLQKIRMTLPVFVALIITMLIVYVILNVDDLNPGTKRTWLAFRQNYSLHEVESGRFQLNPYLDYNYVMQNDFPGAKSLLDAFLINPKLFLHHVLRNIAMLPIAILLFGIPYIGLKIWGLVYGVLLGFAVTIMTQAAVLNPRFLVSRLLRVILERKDLLYVTLASMLSLIPILLVYPKPHHTLIMVPICLLWVGLACLQVLNIIKFPQFSRWSLITLNILVILSILITSKPYASQHPERPVYEKVTQLIELLPRDKIKLMGVGASWYVSYLPIGRVDAVEPLAVAGEDTKNNRSDLRVLLKIHNPDAVIINRELVTSKNFDVGSLEDLKSDRWIKYPIGVDSVYFLREKLKNTHER